MSRPAARKPSLRARLVRHVMGPLALTWLLGTAVTVGVAYYYAQKAFDRALLDDAYTLASSVKVHGQALALELSTREMGAVLFDQSEEVFFSVLRPDGSVLAGHPDLRAPWPEAGARIRFSDIAYRGKLLRSVVVRRAEPGNFLVAVAQTTGSRNALLHRVLLYSVAPQLFLLALLALWLRRVIGQELRPLTELEESVDRRDAQDLTPVPLSASSSDIERLGGAINALLGRLHHSLTAQRELSGNVAHELRTPLAGIRALAEYGLGHAEPAVWREQLQRIALSEARASRLVEQLLALALAEEGAPGVPLAPVALAEVVRETVLRFIARADAAGVDLGVDLEACADAPPVAGDPALIEGIVANLIDNALRYGRPAHGPATVTVALTRQDGRVRLSVTDNGPGLSAPERLLLLQRGVRGGAAGQIGPGAGLGLAIVAKFATVMQARFELAPAPDGGPGLCAQVTFQVGPTPASAS